MAEGFMFDATRKIAEIMRGFEVNWFVAGGWAIDLFLKKQTRPHADIEIAIFRQDQFALQNHFDDRTLKKLENGKFSIWRKGEFLRLPVHEIHCHDKNGESLLEILLNETHGDEWRYRRNESVSKPLSQLYSTTENGVKFLRPEVVLLYKSKNPRAKDEQDFQTAVKFLKPESKKWLKNALSACYPQKHRWSENL